jgi:hypothetical protein
VFSELIFSDAQLRRSVGYHRRVSVITLRRREEREPKFRLARRFVLQPASRCCMRCCAFLLELAIRWRHSAAEFLHLLPRAEDKNKMRKFGSLSSLPRSLLPEANFCCAMKSYCWVPKNRVFSKVFFFFVEKEQLFYFDPVASFQVANGRGNAAGKRQETRDYRMQGL